MESQPRAALWGNPMQGDFIRESPLRIGGSGEDEVSAFGGQLS